MGSPRNIYELIAPVEKLDSMNVVAYSSNCRISTQNESADRFLNFVYQNTDHKPINTIPILDQYSYSFMSTLKCAGEEDYRVFLFHPSNVKEVSRLVSMDNLFSIKEE